MARTSARNANPSLSDDPRDKLAAAISWSWGKMKNSIQYERAPMYFDACRDWHERPSADDQELVRALADVMASAHKDSAEGMAAALPPAPRCPL